MILHAQQVSFQLLNTRSVVSEKTLSLIGEELNDKLDVNLSL